MSNQNTKMALVPTNVNDATTMAQRLSKSQLVPETFRNKPDDVFLAINYGLELGMGPAASLRAIAVIKGTPSLKADAMVGLVMASGLAEYFICRESDGEKATYETKRRGAPESVRKTFSTSDAKTAGLMSNHNYKSYPSHMLEARAKSWLARDVYPDLLHGVYSSEEVAEFDEPRDVTPSNGHISPSEFSAPAPAQDAELVESLDDKIERLKATLDDVTEQPGKYQNGGWSELVDEIKALSQEQRKPLAERYAKARSARDAFMNQGAA